MSKQKMKRIVCAGLAAQMMLSSVVQAAEPLHTLFDSAVPASAAEQTLLAANIRQKEQDEEPAVHTPKLSFEAVEAMSTQEPVENDAQPVRNEIPNEIFEESTTGWVTTTKPEDASDDNGVPEETEGPETGNDVVPEPVPEETRSPIDDSLNPLPDGAISGDDDLVGDEDEEGGKDNAEAPVEPPLEETIPPHDEVDLPGEDVVVDSEETTSATDETTADEPIYFSSEYPNAPTEPVIKYLLKINGYGTKYNYTGDGSKQVQNVRPDYNVEQDEPWIEYENFDYSGGTLTQLIEPNVEMDENMNIWAGAAESIPENFNPGFATQDTWPVWWYYLAMVCNGLVDVYTSFYDIRETLPEYANDTVPWPAPEDIPESFDISNPSTLPGNSMGAEVWKPDDIFAWDDENRLTYFRGELTTPRVPNKMFAGWYIPDLDRNSPLGPADEPYGKYGGPDGPDTNPFVAHGSVTSEYRYESNPYLPFYEEVYADEYAPFDPERPMEDYTYYMGHDRVLAIIGRWVDSDNATATNLTLTPVGGENKAADLYAYEAGIENLTADELAKKAAIDTEDAFTGVRDHIYFARVPYETTKLNFSLYTYEPDSILEITATNNAGQAISFTEWVDQEGETREFVNGNPDNSVTNPARGKRSLDGMEIPLATTTSEQRFTVITMTVTAPDGKSQETYTVYVQRLAQPQMVLNPGNTPYGMIDRTPGWTDAKKAAIKENIKSKGQFVTDTSSSSALDYPNDGSDMANAGINNGGFVYTGVYVPEAWGTYGQTNYDQDSSAIVVYQNATFQVPGFTVYDSMYNPHSEGEEGLGISWDLTMTLVDRLEPAAAQDVPIGIGTEEYSWQGEGTVGQISLHGYSVKPGIYTLTYTFKDPYDYVYHPDGHSEAEQGFTRTVIVLPLRGDVDMDGEVTPADGIMLQQLLDSKYFGETRSDMALYCNDITKRLYYFRVCDVNGDGDINRHDAEALLAGYDTATYGPNEASRAYYQYLPLLDPAKDENKPVQKEAETGTAVTGQVQLEVSYLGFSTDANDIENSDTWDTENPLDYYPNDSTHPNVYWMGVSMKGTENLPEGLKAPLTTFTFTLAYDGSYSEPWVKEGTTWIEYIKSVNPQWDWNKYTLQDSSKTGIVPVNHDGKALSTLEAGDNLRELRFSLVAKSDDGITLQDLEQSGYILKVPFRLISYPRVHMDENKNASLVEAALGMRDMMLTTSETTSNDLGYPVKVSAAWKNQGDEQIKPESVKTTTINLAGSVTYVTENVQIPIGKDNTPSVGITNSKGMRPIYGEPFEADLTHTVDEAGNEVYLGTPIRVEDNGELEKAGLKFDITTRKLTGTPNRIWSEEEPLNFYIVTQGEHQFPFTLIVDKAVLTLTVQSANKYYGETKTDRNSFTYNTEEIKFDSEGGKKNTGSAEDLKELLAGYKAPTIELVEDTNQNVEITATTQPGNYVVKISGGESTNYQFKYVQNGAEIPYDDYGTAQLTIHPRPIFVEKITKKGEDGEEVTLGTLSAGSQTTAVSGQVSYRKEEFTVSAVTDLLNGLYRGIPLTTTVVVVGDDELVLKYSARVDDGNVTNPPTPSEDRPATVTNVELITSGTGNANNCYTLAGNAPLNSAGKITVTRQKLLKVDMEATPYDTVFDYGAELALNPMLVALYFDDDRDENGNMRRVPITGSWDEEFISDYYRSDGLTLQWVDKIYGGKDVPVASDKKYVYKMSGIDEEFPADAAAAYTGQLMTVGGQNGKYLCLSVPGVDETTKENIIHRIYFGPYTVNPKELTLTVQPNYRYYGESNDSMPWNVTFNRAELTLDDQKKLSGTKGNRADLKRILGDSYVEPTAEFHEASNLLSDVVTERTSTGEYYLLLTGGKSDDYTFRYVCTALDGKTTTTDNADAPGYAPMQIFPRPIVITDITTPVVRFAPNDSLPNFDSAKFSATVNATGNQTGFSATLPERNGSYYIPDRSSPVGYRTTTVPYSLSGGAVCKWDNVILQFMVDREGGIETHNPASPYWNLDGKDHVDIEVWVRQINLSNNNNYQLMYYNGPAAAAGHVTEVDGVRKVVYGRVSARMATKVELTNTLPKLDYTYGQTFNMNNFTINVWFDGKETGEGTPVRYSELSDANFANSFLREAGVDVYWLNSDGTLGKTATQGQRLSVAEHNGGQLVIANNSGDILATVTTAVTVQKKTLHLTVQNQSRIYGEKNAAYVAKLPAAELASWDMEALGLTAGAAAKIDSKRLEELDSNYQDSALQFSTEAVKTSDVGSYDLLLSATGVSMANYALETAKGTITVDKRTLRVERFNGPVYSVSQGVKVSTIKDVKRYQGTDTKGLVSEAGTVHDDLVLLPVGVVAEPTLGILQGDFLGLQMDVTFTGSTNDITDNAPVTVSPNSFKLIPVGDWSNYKILTSGTDISAYGQVHKRKVESVSVWNSNSVISTTYTYGDSLDLDAMELKLTYEKEPGEENAPFELVKYADFAAYGISVHYWDSKEAPSIDKLKDILEELDEEGWQAATGDKLNHVGRDGELTHDGMYLLIAVKATPNSVEYSQPMVYGINEAKQLTVNQRQLTYTFYPTNNSDNGGHVDQKPYDRLTTATGRMVLAKGGDHGIVGDDDVFVDASKLMFGFQDADAGVDKTVEVWGIKLIGQDHENYAIPAEVRANDPHKNDYGRPGTPVATIVPNEDRPAPDITITLSVNEHTNAVTVETDKKAVDLATHIKDKKEYRYQYALVDGNGNIIADYQDDPIFGGEIGLEKPGADALPRGIYLGALVRLAATNNYTETEGTCSYDDFQAAVAEAEEGMPIIPEDENIRIIERKEKPGPVVKTYTYRIDLIASEEQKDSEGKISYTTELNTVWFTDIANIATEKELNRLVDNLSTVRYTAYGWNPSLSVKLRFPMDLTQPIMENLPVEKEDGTTEQEEIQVNQGDILPIYVTAKPQSSGSSTGYYIYPRKVTIDPDGLLLRLNDAPVQLELIFEPEEVTDRRVTWSSSDESVVTVSKDGTVTVVGVGTATITVTTWNYLTDSITVQVVEGYDIPFKDTMFNAAYQGSFMELFEGYFRPEQLLTRQELTVVMEHFFQQVEQREPSRPDVFFDVPEEANYAQQVHTLNIWGIVNGVGESLYAPGQYATRAEISAILCRMLMLPVSNDPEGPHAFLDAGPEDTWAWAYIDALAKAGITLGTGDGMYSPNRILTRAEVATMISRILITDVDIDGADVIVPLDVAEEHWAYRHVLRAVNSDAVLLVKSKYRKV